MSLIFFFLLFWVYSGHVFVQATNITTTHFLTDSESLLSSNAIFKIGFFSPPKSSHRYVGIWYDNKNDSGALKIAWVANRERPLNDSSGFFKLSKEGDLQVLDGESKIIWSSNVSSRANNNSVAQLLDTGNFVLRSSANGPIIWQSFEHATDSICPPLKLTLINDKPLLWSWASPSDPSPGRFKASLHSTIFVEIFIFDRDEPYWRSGPWTGNSFLGLPYMHTERHNGFDLVRNLDGTYQFTYNMMDEWKLHRFELTYDGTLFEKHWDDSVKQWLIYYKTLQSECDVFGHCGPFGSCNPYNTPACGCLRGFMPKNSAEWSNGNWTSGCVRRTPLQCGTTRDSFLLLEHMKVPYNAQWFSTSDQTECRQFCSKSCSCWAYSYYTGVGCMFWNQSLIDIQQFPDEGADLFIRLAHSELGEASKRKTIFIAPVIVVILCAVVLMFYLWRRMVQRKGKKNSQRDARVDKQLESQELPLVEFAKLEVATNYFSEENKLGQGGFGPVYKGTLEDGQQIAVKRLSKAGGQGPQEFMSEVVVISKLQHRNLVRLSGYCIEGEEKLLVYEYMPNKSLDALLFDPLQRGSLDWKKRFSIIKGICRGLLYLHRDSRLRIIHRDLKASNILLDEEFNPKISDFGMARIFGGKQDQANTIRIVGTYGYMSPEYAMEGRFSEKSDVFSFGVLLLEIVSGRRNSNSHDIGSPNLLTYTWESWKEGNILDIVDNTISDPSHELEISRCITVGLLCVQEFPEERPNISLVSSMLDTSELMDLPHPTKPGYIRTKMSHTNASSQSNQENSSGTVNGISITAVIGR